METDGMTVSIFTPTHKSDYLPKVYESLLAQTDADWEWVIVYNNGASKIDFSDTRIKSYRLDNAPEWVGPLKNYACQQAVGDILLELDHDDLLHPESVAKVKKAFDNSKVGFVYSNTVHATGDMQPIQRFDSAYGWHYREVEWDGYKLDEHISFPPTPDSISRIWFAPNHLRAFRRSCYEQVGGYSQDMRILDDLDLMARLYQITEFKHINEGLYLYRVHGENSWLRYNAEIQNNVYRIYDQYIEAMSLRWAGQNGLRKIDLGGRINHLEGYESVDLFNADICCDLNKSWPFEDNSIGVIRANDIVEHLANPLHVMKEAYRVLSPGGWLMVFVPSTDGRGAFQDPTHRSYWNENSFLYYTDKRWAQYIDSPVKFQAARLFTTEHNDNKICWTIAHLISLKNGYRPPGLISI